MAGDIKQQVISEIKNLQFGLFSIQLNETTKVASCSQLFGVLQILDRKKNNILFCSALETNTRAVDVMEKLEVPFDQEEVKWENSVVYALMVLLQRQEQRSGLQTLALNHLYDGISMHDTQCIA